MRARRGLVVMGYNEKRFSSFIEKFSTSQRCFLMTRSFKNISGKKPSKATTIDVNKKLVLKSNVRETAMLAFTSYESRAPSEATYSPCPSINESLMT